MYRRAPYLLSQLEARIGTEAFNRFIAAYMTEGVTTTPQLLEQLQAAAGAEAAAWFREQLASRPPPAS
jgi:aminopeptidase N